MNNNTLQLLRKPYNYYSMTRIIAQKQIKSTFFPFITFLIFIDDTTSNCIAHHVIITE